MSEQRERQVVVVVGSSPTTRHMAPVGDPGVQLWSLNDCWQFLSPDHPKDRTLWWEMHEREWFTGPTRPENHLEWLRTCGIPIFMLDRHEDIPTSIAYPEDQIVADLGCRRYFTSSFSYILAYAAVTLCRGDELHVYGIDLTLETEYFQQRACAEYWFGRIEGKGVKVVTPKACPLLRGPHYGRPDPDEAKRLVQTRTLEERLRLLTAEKAMLGAKFNQNQGRIDEAQYLRALLADR